ncbi:hypothetical protein PV325_010887, partial [Microctonus aethiopoides]
HVHNAYHQKEQTNQNISTKSEINKSNSTLSQSDYTNDAQEIKQLIAITADLNPTEADIKTFIKRTTRSISGKRKIKIIPSLNKRGKKDKEQKLSSASEMDTEDENQTNNHILKTIENLNAEIQKLKEAIKEKDKKILTLRNQNKTKNQAIQQKENENNSQQQKIELIESSQLSQQSSTINTSATFTAEINADDSYTTMSKKTHPQKIDVQQNKNEATEETHAAINNRSFSSQHQAKLKPPAIHVYNKPAQDIINIIKNTATSTPNTQIGSTKTTTPERKHYNKTGYKKTKLNIK